MEFPFLTAEEVRVLGALVEKAITTPDNYPLSLNALTNACNQLSNRDPVVLYGEATVRSAVETLRDRKLGFVFDGADSRVLKYGQKFAETLALSPAEVAVMCVLMLRGPQTIGEIRGRTGRIHNFSGLEEVETTLSALAARPEHPLISKLPRQPGCKESRYAHLLSGPIEMAPSSSDSDSPVSAQSSISPSPDLSERIARLEIELSNMRSELADVRQQVTELLRQLS